MSSADRYSLHLRDEFKRRMEREIPKLVATAMAPFYEMIEMLAQHLDSRSPALVSGLDSEVDSDSVMDSDSNSSAELGLDSSSQALVLDPDLAIDSDSESNPLGVSDFVCSEVTPDDSINSFSFLSQPPPNSGNNFQSFTLPPLNNFRWHRMSPRERQEPCTKVIRCNEDMLVGSRQCCQSKRFPPFLNVTSHSSAKDVPLIDIRPFDPGPLEYSPQSMEKNPSRCSFVCSNSMVSCVDAPIFNGAFELWPEAFVETTMNLPGDREFYGCGICASNKYFRSQYVSDAQHVFVEIPHQTYMKTCSDAQLQIDSVGEHTIFYFMCGSSVPVYKLHDSGIGGTLLCAKKVQVTDNVVFHRFSSEEFDILKFLYTNFVSLLKSAHSVYTLFQLVTRSEHCDSHGNCFLEVVTVFFKLNLSEDVLAVIGHHSWFHCHKFTMATEGVIDYLPLSASVACTQLEIEFLNHFPIPYLLNILHHITYTLDFIEVSLTLGIVKQIGKRVNYYPKLKFSILIFYPGRVFQSPSTRLSSMENLSSCHWTESLLHTNFEIHVVVVVLVGLMPLQNATLIVTEIQKVSTIKDCDDASLKGYLWQNFHYTIDAMLTRMSAGWNFKVGLGTNLPSWKNITNPPLQECSSNMDAHVGCPFHKGIKQIFISGQWNEHHCEGNSILKGYAIYKSLFVFYSTEAFYWYETNNNISLSLVFCKFRLSQHFIWNHFYWFPMYNTQGDYDHEYGLGGSYGICITNHFPNCNSLHFKQWDPGVVFLRKVSSHN